MVTLAESLPRVRRELVESSHKAQQTWMIYSFSQALKELDMRLCHYESAKCLAALQMALHVAADTRRISRLEA
jgi:hypothetical protein